MTAPVPSRPPDPDRFVALGLRLVAPLGQVLMRADTGIRASDLLDMGFALPEPGGKWVRSFMVDPGSPFCGRLDVEVYG